MRYVNSLLLGAIVLGGCGKTSKEPASEVQPSATPAQAEVKPAEASVTAPPDVVAGTDPEREVVRPKPLAEPAWLVWTSTKEGYTTSWIRADGSVVASRPEVSAFADGTLWAVQPKYASFRELGCPELVEDDADAAPTSPRPQRFMPYLVARGLAGTHANTERQLMGPWDVRLEEQEKPAPGADVELVGEQGDRTQDLTGGVGGQLWATDCGWSFTCGAHGNAVCVFKQLSLDPAVQPVDLEALGKGREAEMKALGTDPAETDPDRIEVNKALAGQPSDVELFSPPSIVALGLDFRSGAVQLSYRAAWEVPYAATDGSWSSYTVSRAKELPLPVAGLVTAPPEAVQKFLGQHGDVSGVGWSELPAEAHEAALNAFKDEQNRSVAAPAGAIPARTSPDDAPPSSP